MIEDVFVNDHVHRYTNSHWYWASIFLNDTLEVYFCRFELKLKKTFKMGYAAPTLSTIWDSCL